MTDKIDDGGPAFPLAGIDESDSPHDFYPHQEGMSLRDWYAGQALGAKTEGGLIGYEDHAPEHRKELIRRLVRDCVEIADEMIAALKMGRRRKGHDRP